MTDLDPQIDPPVSSLSAAFQAALDEAALCGFDPRRVGSPSARRLLGLLDLLNSPSPDEPTMLADGSAPGASLLVDVTVARVLRTPRTTTLARIDAPSADLGLTPESAERLDTVARDHWNTSDGAVTELLALLDAGAPAPQDSDRRRLVDATMERIHEVSEADRARFRLSPARPERAPIAGGIRLSDIASVAAVVLIGSAVLWPMLSSAREQGRQIACAANLGRAASGFSMYAGDYDDALPSANASFFGGKWWDVGRERSSHSANLYRLVSGRYNSLAELACPGNHDAPVRADAPEATDWHAPSQVSYSYQLFGSDRPRWNGSSRILVLSDKSPVVDRARKGERVSPLMNSRNHEGRGQSALLSDGSVEWLATPLLGPGDNMWLPATLEGLPEPILTGREQPLTERDAFVGP